MLPRGVWRFVTKRQHGGVLGRVVVDFCTRPLRHRDLRVVGGPLAGARINLGGSFLGYLTGDAEPDVQNVLAEIIEPGQVVFDIGANIGFFTLLCARQVGPRGKVYAFEPMPANAKTLRHNIALNNLDNVIVVEKALSSTSGRAELFISRYSAFHSLNVEGAVKRNNRGPEPDAETPIWVETTTLDDFVLNGDAQVPDVIKLDVEGAELVALEGMRATLESRKPLLVCELHWTNVPYMRFVDSIGYRARVLGTHAPDLADADGNVHTLAWPQVSAGR
jgi:FkbM family methyltransferase